MTIDIRITTLDPAQYGPENEQLEEALRAIGFVRAGEVAQASGQAESSAVVGFSAEQADTLQQALHDPENQPSQFGTVPARQRGKPAPGRARRTKEEIAEDDAADAAEANEVKLNAGSFQPDQNISASPEDRVDPENPADSEADAEQDEADEAAEAEANAGPITLDDIRKVVGEYQRDFGMDAATKDLPPVWRKICGEDCTKLSMIPEDKLAEVHAAIQAAHQKAGK